MTVNVVVMEPTDDRVVKPVARYKPSTVPFSFILSHIYSKRLEEYKESQDKVTGHKYRG